LKSLPNAAEYLEAEREADFKSEYYQGHIYPLYGGDPVRGTSGATVDHNRIAGNLLREIGTQLKSRPCEAFGSDMKVRVDPDDCFFYPDISGLCGPMDFHDGKKDVYLNPAFIIEVLSDSTESFDRRKKFLSYRKIASLREYILVSQKSETVEIFRKEGELWNSEVVHEGALILDSVSCGIPFDEIYRNVSFDEGPRCQNGYHSTFTPRIALKPGSFWPDPWRR